MEAHSLNHWTTREVLPNNFCLHLTDKAWGQEALGTSPPLKLKGSFLILQMKKQGPERIKESGRLQRVVAKDWVLELDRPDFESSLCTNFFTLPL